jgi:hypothetical protein
MNLVYSRLGLHKTHDARLILHISSNYFERRLPILLAPAAEQLLLPCLVIKLAI